MEKDVHFAQIEFRNVTKTYGSVTAVKDLSLSVRRGEFLTILGPSGSGKTTALMLLAGFQTPNQGNIFIAGKSVAAVPSYRRDQGIVFQSYALFPHLTVRRNLEFPLEMRGVIVAERAKRVDRILARVHLNGLDNRMPSQLSGGQQQRVALARALIADPPILLLDEPLGALDRNLREQMQTEIKSLHKEFGITTVCVTHDQDEALTLSDRVVVMQAGRIEQTDTPEAIYDRPTTKFVAKFLGEANILDKAGFMIESDAPQPEGTIPMIRPERICVAPLDAPKRVDADQCQSVKGTVDNMIYAGPLRKYHVRVASTVLVVREHVASGRRALQPGEEARLEWLRSDVRFVRA
ncbi:MULTISPECIES: ABC transporter ATP-binding protein [unclassified Bradyrhizobium]|uniref:ABC transporter ATP-binding protein n=1 Tax=unclassified Bradyrhizobium TaxID=2631580 RepID=UPI001CD64095|nr:MULTISPECIES: ABC transporter ATP-binding protein [unclassified Bradyrhizobium]MCA1386370.1 ABC transporter ATP-binding protein [Bradyrhizobium sp. BRP05]MCA1394473.1 ABC transporter ATP-binding protein [Bradyrhizobium sp. IC3123]MCA1423966.1 ABC transporter ATP-binding protein [Bradyrhizobium sp. BRP23]MCA1431116.1 ABC transporter ATP-binding protein [Bradyrhizobium sp. NBAIM16]MCA1480544.1 ABC transporter ATP-binding protein [Bradyrhizobium sp. NBAIM08]